ncbi:ABC transporter substrate-binding protein [Bosea sp. Root381]|uniref:TRAP transporter substrate-binding protein n=1 Tax=Bosea sp. Root381 TaxID=1736524 RepID=UPI0006FEFF05|nr:TRAP transporter substrate-binding protein [Bosea sp. Root381]KRD99994.1 ABC transporter substrate-binding protein [Bosea sp. Root381]
MKTLALAAGFVLATLPISAQAEIKNRTIRISAGVNEDHPVAGGVKVMTQCIAEKSGGKIKMTAFWGGALGTDQQQTQSLRSGTQEMTITSTSPLVGILPALGAFDLPFIFKNEKEADGVLDGEFGADISAMLPSRGLINLAYWENGFRNLTNSRRPVTKWEDISGMKVRVMQNGIFIDTFNNMGANAVPMSFGELFSALDTKAIDAQENPFVTIDSSKFYEVQKYLSVTRHAYTPYLALFSKPIWDGYSAEEKKILQDCTIAGRDAQRRIAREQSADALDKLKKQGMQVVEFTEAEQARMRDHAKSVLDKHAPAIGKDTVAKLLAAIDKVRATN